MPTSSAELIQLYTNPVVAAFMRQAGNTTADVARLLRTILVPNTQCALPTPSSAPKDLQAPLLKIAQSAAESVLNVAFNAHMICGLYAEQTDKNEPDIVARLYQSGRTAHAQRVHVINFAAAEIKAEIESVCSQPDDNHLSEIFNYTKWQQTTLRTWLMKSLQETINRAASRNPLPRDKKPTKALAALDAAFVQLDKTLFPPHKTFDGNLLSDLTLATREHLHDKLSDMRAMMQDATHPHRSRLAGDILEAHGLHEPLYIASERGLPLCAQNETALLGELLMVLEGTHLALTRGPWRVSVFQRYQAQHKSSLSLQAPEVKDALTGACTLMGKKIEAATADLRAKIASYDTTAPHTKSQSHSLAQDLSYPH